MRTLLTACAVGAATIALSACASDGYGYNGYSNSCGRNNELAGAAVGAGVGALAGGAVAGRGDRTEGAVIGGVAGAVVGSQVAKSNRNRNCGPYYDGQGRPYYQDDRGRPYYR